MPLNEKRRTALAMKWIIKTAREKSGKSMEEKLFDEIMDAYKGEVCILVNKTCLCLGVKEQQNS